MGTLAANAQTRDITGKVISGEDDAPIPGVSIQVKGTTLGTVSDMDGEFTLHVPANAKILVFSFVGMTTQEVAIDGKTNISITMGAEALGLDEVMVVAYGTAKKESFTGSA